MAWLDQVDGATGGRADRRHAGSLGLLDRLAESLELTGVHEDVQAGERVGQVFAIQPTGEYCGGHQGLQLVHLRAIADDDQLHIVPPVQGCHALHGLLRSQSAYKADDLPVRFQRVRARRAAALTLAFQQPFAPQFRRALGRVEALRIHATPPVRHAAHAVFFQLAHRHGARGQRHGTHVVHDSHPAPCHLGQELHLVVVGESGNVGLEDRHARQLQRLGHYRACTAQDEGAG